MAKRKRRTKIDPLTGLEYEEGSIMDSISKMDETLFSPARSSSSRKRSRNPSMSRKSSKRRRRRSSHRSDEIDLSDLPPWAQGLIGLILAAIVLNVLYGQKIMAFWNQYKILIFAVLVLLIGGGIFAIIKIILPSKTEAKIQNKREEEIEKRIIRKKLMKLRARELEDLDEDEKEHLLNKWVEEEYRKGDSGILGSGITSFKHSKIAPPLTGAEQSKLIHAVGNICEHPNCSRGPPLQAHHIQPQSKGGTNRLNNLIVLCPNHHDEADRGVFGQSLLKTWITDKHGGKRFKWNLYREWKW